MKRIIILTMISVVTLYVATYIVFSLQGQYVPGCIGLSWVKSYLWAPKGFVSDSTGLKWNTTKTMLFRPLLSLDWRAWHNDETPDRDKHKVNTTVDDALEKERGKNQQVEHTP